MQRLIQYGTLAIIVIGSVYLALHQELVRETLTAVGSLGLVLGRLVFVGMLVTAVVLAPVTVMPLIPLASQLFGPFLTGILSVLGWTMGAVIAFLIARYAGRPVLERYVSIENIDQFVASVPERNQFWFMVLVRHLLPVDVVSYALGLVPAIRFRTYLMATILGVTWFSFAFAYLGEAFFSGNLYLFVEIALASLAILIMAWYMLRRQKGKNDSQEEN